MRRSFGHDTVNVVSMAKAKATLCDLGEDWRRVLRLLCRWGTSGEVAVPEAVAADLIEKASAGGIHLENFEPRKTLHVDQSEARSMDIGKRATVIASGWTKPT